MLGKFSSRETFLVSCLRDQDKTVCALEKRVARLEAVLRMSNEQFVLHLAAARAERPRLMPRLRCFLKELRGPESLRSLAERADFNAGELSRIESGSALPRDEDVPALERAYGAPITDWYHPLVLVAIEFDDAALDALRERVHEAWRRSV